MKVEAVIFDLDGLLVDSEVYWEQARAAYAASQGCNWTRRNELDAKGLNSREWASLIRAACNLNLQLDQIIHAVENRMQDLYRSRLPLLPGAVSAVRALAARFPLAVASSSPLTLISFVLSAAHLRDCFKVIVSSDQVGVGKPSPDVFLAAAHELHRPPESTVVFEDSTAGILGAKAAGMMVIAIPNPHYPPSDKALAAADRVLGSLEEVRPAALTSLEH